MRDIVCSRCVHRYVIEGVGSPPSLCPRCQEPLRWVSRETHTQLRQTRRHGQALVSSAPRGRFRTAVKTQVQVSWIPLIDVERLMTALVNAVDQAARGHRDVGYVCLIDGLREAEVSAVAGAPWGGALLRRYLELLDVYTVRYDVCREAEEPRDEPSLLAESRLLADPPLAIVEMDEEEVDSCLTS
jgi:hypothetical protein